MEPARVERVTGRRFAGCPATLHGWTRTIASHGYPVIHPSSDDTVDGIVLDGLDTAALRALDAYEGQLYLRRQVTVLVGAESTPCEAYVGHSSSSRSRY